MIERVGRNSAGLCMERLLAALLVTVFVVQCLLTAEANSPANDEGKHLVTGWWLLNHRRCCLGIDNSPLTAYLALPLLTLDVREDPRLSMGLNSDFAGHLFIFGSPDPELMVLASRYSTILVGIVMLIVAAWLANQLYGKPAGLFTLSLLAFDPNLIAHFSLISTDALLTATTVIFLATLHTMILAPTPGHATTAGITLGLALLSKFTALVLLPATLLLLLLYPKALRNRPPALWLGRSVLAALTAATALWVGYGFQLASNPPYFILPGFADGLRQAREYASLGMVAYLNGEIGLFWRSYFLVALALKTPIPLLMLWALALTAALPNTSEPSGRSRWAPTLLAAVFYAAALSSNLNIGLRHLLPVYPLMAIACGSLIPFILKRLPLRRRLLKSIPGLLCAWLAIETLSISPFYLAYFNQFAGGPIGGARYLSDSNIDWGQDLKRLKHEMNKHGINEVILSYFGNTNPAFYGIRYQYLPRMVVGSTQGDRAVGSRQEVLAVSIMNLHGILLKNFDFKWLASRRPFARAGYSILLYDITGDAEAHRYLAAIYKVNKLDGLARKECEKVAAIEANGLQVDLRKPAMTHDPCASTVQHGRMPP